jgi:putative endonuclease
MKPERPRVPARPLVGAPKPETKSLGDFGERIAAEHLEAKGFAIVERNFRVVEGEIDLVARDGDTIVFVEVRTRRGGATGMAALSVGPRKAAQLLRAAEWYVERHPHCADLPQRIDVVTVELHRDGTLRTVTHFEDAVRPD